MDSVILSSQELAADQKVRILMHDGQVKAHIEEITMTTQAPLSFEAAYARLEEILEKMNSGKVSLEEVAEALRRGRPAYRLEQ